MSSAEVPADAGGPFDEAQAGRRAHLDASRHEAVIGAAVAGRLEGMRARELGASLRAKVQENEAMKRYVDSLQVGSDDNQ